LVPILEKDIKQKEKDFLNDKGEIKLSDIDTKSPSIDLIIAKLPTKKTRLSSDVIRLYAFDLTLKSKPELIKGKISNFLHNFLKFKDNDQMSINLNGVNHPV
jgi:hypothetical protein